MTFTQKTIFFVTVLTAFAVLMALGTWQVKRLAWKQDLLATIAKQQAQTPLVISHYKALKDFQPVTLKGEFLYAYEKFLTPRTRDGVKGVHHIVPLMFENGKDMMFVNRGFIPDDQMDDLRPMQGQVEITGYVRELPHQGVFTPDNNAGEKNIYWVDRKGFVDEYDMPLKSMAPYVFYQTSVHSGPPYPLPHTANIDIPNNHFQYAVFWFFMGFVMLVIATLFYIRQKKHDR